MSFLDIAANFDYSQFKKRASQIDESVISNIIGHEDISFADFGSLLSKAAENNLGRLAGRARDLTIQRFGRTISFYNPVYLSNVCYNSCLYCGFNHQTDGARTTLDSAQIEEEYIVLKKAGFDNVLLLTGYAPEIATIEYISDAIRLAKKYFTFVALEIYPMEVEEYKCLVDAGADGLTIYQETYDRTVYEKMHVGGRKKDFQWRIEAPERAALAGFRKIGLGSLLGLAEWQFEAAMLASHIQYLQKKFWKVEYTLGFPRINPPSADFAVPCPVTDKELVHMMCALRLFLPDTGFLLTTRERPELRNNLIDLCITQISAGSRTNPGGYTREDTLEQFHISDDRDIVEMSGVVKSKGYEPVLKDWEASFTGVERS